MSWKYIILLVVAFLAAAWYGMALATGGLDIHSSAAHSRSIDLTTNQWLRDSLK